MASSLSPPQEAIVDYAENHRTDLRAKQELWRIGLPPRPTAQPAKPVLTERPSLANVSGAMLNMRRAITIGEA